MCARTQSAATCNLWAYFDRLRVISDNKWLCARDEIDQSASVIMMSWGEAERRGIPDEKL